MKKLIATMLTMFLCLSIFPAVSETCWVDESWGHVEIMLDCDGLPMIINADVLAIQPNITVQEYKTGKISNSYAEKLVREIDWEEIGVYASGGKYVSDTGYYYTGSDVDFGVYPFFELFIRHNDSPYTDNVVDYQYNLDHSDLLGLAWQDIIEQAKLTATHLNIQVGQPRYMRRLESFLHSAKALYGDHWDDIRNLYLCPPYASKQYTDEELDYIKTIEIFMPAYYNGMRLFSGTSVDLPGEAFIPLTSFAFRMHHEGWIVSMSCPIFDSWTPISEESLPLTFDEALHCLQETYADMYLPGVSGIVVHEAALEYTLMAADQTARKGFTVYPTWVFRISLQYGEDSSSMDYIGIHAITGKKIF